MPDKETDDGTEPDSDLRSLDGFEHLNEQIHEGTVDQSVTYIAVDNDALKI